MSTPTSNPVPSQSPLDLPYNAERLDEVVNSSALTFTDRLGVSRLTLAGAIESIKAINNRGAWAPYAIYAAKDVASSGGSWYIAVDNHTAGASFAGDLAAHWRLYQGVTSADLASTSAGKGAEMVGFSGGGTAGAELTRLRGVVLPSGRVSIGSNATTTPNDALLVHRAITGTTDCHAVRDESTISGVTDYGGYGAFDAAPSLSGTHVQNHVFSFQDRVVYSGSGAGALENQAGLYSEPSFSGAAGSVQRREGVRIMEYVGSAGVVAEQAGLTVRALTKATKNYGVLVQGAPMNVFGGRTVFGLVADPAVNEGVSHYGAGLSGGTITSFQASGVGLGVVGTWSWAGFKSTPVMPAAANAGGTLVGFWARDAIPEVGSPSIAANVGVSIDNISGLSVFGLISQITAGATRWALYLIGGAKSFLGGKSYFGGTTATDPTATIHVAAGSAAAGSAPIKLTAGTLMATPENGAIEYDGTHVYITIGGVRKQLD